MLLECQTKELSPAFRIMLSSNAKGLEASIYL